MKIKLILATDLKGCIGYNNDLIFKSKRDLKRFKELTTNNIVVMGSKTYSSLGNKPLPNRVNVVLSKKLNDPNVLVFDNKYKMIENMIAYYPDKEIWIIGGSDVYNQFIKVADEIYLTKFHSISNVCDTFFNIDLISEYFGEGEIVETFYENDIKIEFINYKKYEEKI